nr:hypothetical protein [Tanacetum cinerariifolium]
MGRGLFLPRLRNFAFIQKLFKGKGCWVLWERVRKVMGSSWSSGEKWERSSCRFGGRKWCEQCWFKRGGRQGTVEEMRDEKKRLDHLKQDQTMLVIKRFSGRKKVFRERKRTRKIHTKRGEGDDKEFVVMGKVGTFLLGGGDDGGGGRL